MNTKLSTLLLSVIFGLTACSVDDTSITPSDNPDDISWEKPDYTSVKCDDPVEPVPRSRKGQVSLLRSAPDD